MRVSGKTSLAGFACVLCAAQLWVSPGAFAAAAIEDIDTKPSQQTERRGGANAPAVRSEAIAPATANLTLQERVQRLERVMGNQALLDMLRRMEELQLEVQTLRAQVEELSHGLEGMQSRQRDIYLDVDRRIQQIENRGGPAAASTDGSQSGAPLGGSAASGGEFGIGGGLAATAPPAADAASARAAYEQAFGALREGRYEQAISGFEGFVATYPQSEYAGNAQYWLGEANYVTRRFERAIQEFNKLITNYPDSAKVPDAHLKIGFTYYEMGKWAEARRALTEVQRRHSNSAAARLAAERLSRMTQEGH